MRSASLILTLKYAVSELERQQIYADDDDGNDKVANRSDSQGKCCSGVEELAADVHDGDLADGFGELQKYSQTY